jgi:reverse gyrase
LRNRLQSENVCARAAENEIDLNVAAEVFLKQLDGARCERIVAVSDDVTFVAASASTSRMNTGVVVAGETAFGMAQRQEGPIWCSVSHSVLSLFC